MKVLLVFLCILIVFTAAFVFESDFFNCLRVLNYLERLAEEASIAAAMYYDEEAFGQGIYILSETEGTKAVEYIVSEANRKLSAVREGILTYTLLLSDAEKGFEGTNSNPCATVTITYTTEDLFRLPFLRRTSLSRSATYEIR